MRKLRILSILMVICMLLIPLQIQAVQDDKVEKSIVYTALGDSIAAGVTWDNGSTISGGYVGLLSEKLGEVYKHVRLNNMAVSGDTSSDLLTLLQEDKDTQKAVKKSDIITVCIGANNILGPLYEAVVDGIPTDPAELAVLLNSLVPSLETGINQMANDWIAINDEIKKLAPHAEVYVMNVYNPLIYDADNPLYNSFLYTLADGFILRLNNIIAGGESEYGYEVVDVYSAFKAAGSEVAGLTGFYASFDPHPTVQGHTLICTLHEAAMELE